MKLKVDDYLPGEWLSPSVDGSNVEGKFKTRKGVLALHKENLQVVSVNFCNIFVYNIRFSCNIDNVC